MSETMTSGWRFQYGSRATSSRMCSRLVTHDPMMVIDGWIRVGLTSGTVSPLPSPTSTTRPSSRTSAIAVPRPGSLPEQSMATSRAATD